MLIEDSTTRIKVTSEKEKSLVTLDHPEFVATLHLEPTGDFLLADRKTGAHLRFGAVRLG